MQRASPSLASSPRPALRVVARAARLAAALAIAAIGLTPAWSSPVAAVDGEITSEGPLTRVIVSTDLNCQVEHEDDLSLEFFGDVPGACGTFLAVDGTVYGPAVVPAGGAGSVAWTPVSQEAATGSGRGGDPYRLVTVTEAGDIGIRVEQTDSYENGQESYRTDVRISNEGGEERRAILYRAGDCFLQDSDVGFGRVDDGAPACVISQASDSRIQQWVPVSPGSRYFEGRYGDLWQRIGSQEPFPNECLCDQAVDNGAGLSWEVVIPAGGSVEVAHLTFFSPEGRQPTTTLRDSVPGPADITLFVPFPAALFNSTLEEHYAEVTAGVARLRAWLGRLFALGWARGRRAVSEAQARRAAAAAGGSPVATASSPASAPGSPAAASTPLAPEPSAPEPTHAAAGPAKRGFALDEAFWTSPLGILAFIMASALLYGLLDPTFGIDLSSLATFLGLALGMIVMVLAFGIPMFIGARRQKLGLSARALPGTLLVALACVLISRIADFQPGYLYGLIIGFTFSRVLSKAETGRLDAFAAGTALALAVIAWILLPIVRDSDAADARAFTAAMIEAALATVVVAGLEAAAISMLPLRFLPGERVRAWNQRVWAGILGTAAFGFCHLLLNPQSGYLADSTRTSLFTVVLLLAVFGGGSVLFWAYFRFRPQRATPAAPPPPMPSGEPPAA
jgi:hypothetical protein